MGDHRDNQDLDLDVDSFRGGVAIWGAVAPIYYTTRTAVEQGVHVHARRVPGGPKEIDGTFRRVRAVRRHRQQLREIVISELEAVYYMVSSVLGFQMKRVDCTFCGFPHLDKDWFSVHPHRRHLCAGCGKHFRDAERAIGNRVAAAKEAFQARHTMKPARKVIDIDQSKYPGGIQIWGSNPALLWTARRSEEEGIHVHAVGEDGCSTVVDETFSRVTVDSVQLDDPMIRILMAQSALPHIAGRLVSLRCPRCLAPHFDTGADAFTPHEEHCCNHCQSKFRSSGRLRKKVGNPMIHIFAELGRRAHQPPQQHRNSLLIETI